MRIAKAPNATPHSTPPSSGGSKGAAAGWAPDERYIWTSLVPRLVDPTKLVLIRALIEVRRPQSLDDLSLLPELDGDPREIQRHLSDMTNAGALEVVSAQAGAGDRVPHYFFPPEQTR
jgi:hypothetical protein